MAGEGTRYEVTEIKAIRGTESKTIASKQQDGWELVTQQEGRLRTTMTFRRPKPKPPWRLWAALGGAAVILVSIITAGALLEDDSAASQADAEAASNTAQPAPEGEAEPSSTADPMICETTPVEDTCKFGQTAIYRDSVRSGEVELEITVGAPVEFTPSQDADIMYERPPQAVSVYFPVTIKNTSPELAVGMIHGQATNVEQGGTGVESVTDGDIDSFAVGRAEGMPVGESVSVKDGWTMTTLDGVEYNLQINGLAGYAITFTR
ncbi:hypothetical protein [Gordonia sp. UCD-TK1]|uniref:hypothetical protein n=1 Tax=Gordonia sp. UCD-TK1 TaxID=1857893 RepID=UPI00080DC4F0|nr:hypothetical protein [Gordonia sp. UCD-TK1]OCH81432.1 hypothetical protein A9310_17230 [Gordonia sp. UCD-TK1]